MSRNNLDFLGPNEINWLGVMDEEDERIRRRRYDLAMEMEHQPFTSVYDDFMRDSEEAPWLGIGQSARDLARDPRELLQAGLDVMSPAAFPLDDYQMPEPKHYGIDDPGFRARGEQSILGDIKPTEQIEYELGLRDQFTRNDAMLEKDWNPLYRYADSAWGGVEKLRDAESLHSELAWEGYGDILGGGIEALLESVGIKSIPKGVVPGAGTVIGSDALNFTDYGMLADDLALRKVLDLENKLPEPKKLAATGFGEHPAGKEFGLTRTVSDQGLEMDKVPVPNEAEFAANLDDLDAIKAWDDLRGQDPLGDFGALRDANPELFGKKSAAEANMYQFDQKFNMPQVGPLKESIRNSVAVEGYPRIGNYELTRDFNIGPRGEKSGTNILVGENNIPIAGHELGHGVSDIEGWPRGGNTKEMETLKRDLLSDHKQYATAIEEAEIRRRQAVGAGDLSTADVWAKEVDVMSPKRSTLEDLINVRPFDRYQALMDERIQRYTQYGIEKNLSPDELRMFTLEDFLEGERRRTGLGDIIMGPNQRLKVSDLLR